jgi:hypothetical protein
MIVEADWLAERLTDWLAERLTGVSGLRKTRLATATSRRLRQSGLLAVYPKFQICQAPQRKVMKLSDVRVFCKVTTSRKCMKRNDNFWFVRL